MNPNKVLVAMSGGVDSSVTAALLKQQGFDVTGAFMINWREDEDGCGWEKDYEDARRVAAKLNINLFTWNFSNEYKQKVFNYFIDSYKNGITPNPDTLCNKYIKFGSFLEKAAKHGFDKIATGHYARVEKKENTYKLLSGIDKTKDQSYFLYELNQKQLSETLFPVGKLKKKKIRQLAREFDLPVSEKKDSYGICYIGKKDMKQFLGKFIESKPGDIVDDSGKLLGKHAGLHTYTIGQRQGIGIGQTGPYYVLGKNKDTNQLIVTNNPKHKKLYTKITKIKSVNWLDKPIKNKFKCLVRFRHLQKLIKATIILKDDTIKVDFKDKQKAVAPGQALVMYKKESLLSKNHQLIGGGIITT